MGKRERTPEIPFWEERDVGNGMVAVRVPGSVQIKPCNGKYRYASRFGSYVTNDPRFGEGAIVSIFWDSELQENVKEVIMKAPEDIVLAAIEGDKADYRLQRRSEENADIRIDSSGTDENGDYHLGAMDQAAYEQYVRRENAPEQEEEYGEADLIGELSDDPRIRNAQIRYMCQVIDKALMVLTEKNRIYFRAIFNSCMKEVEIAAEMGVGKSAVSNQKKRLMTGMAEVFRNIGFRIPTKAEIKAEQKAAEKRNAMIEKAEAEEKKMHREISMIHAMTEVFYRNGMLSSEEKDMIESDLDAAA